MPEAGLVQDDRPIQIGTPLGQDVLLVTAFSGREGLGEMFDFHIDVISEKTSIEATEIVGKGTTLSIRMPDAANGSPRFRHWNGVVTDFIQTSSQVEKYTSYRLRLRPWFWLLTRTSDCQIFQNMTVIDIVQKIFSNFKFADFANKTTRSYETREYCVQYRETAANFVMRLFEEEGIYCYFEHEEKKHTLVMADNSPAASALPIQSKFRWEPVRGTAAEGQEDTISGWERRFQIQPKRWMLQDYNFETPHNDVKGITDTIVQNSVPNYEMFDYPGLFKDSGLGGTMSKNRMQESESAYEVIFAQGSGRSMKPGFRFTFTDHPIGKQNGEYVITTVLHTGGQTAYRSAGGGGAESEHYSNSFTCIPRAIQYRHARITPKPVVNGSQTAFVVGPAGEEIYVDKYGRIKVQFHWDRYGDVNENSSCWMRVSQAIAGIKWGSIYIPRIGQEVVVDFLEGDPDRPLVTGCVYNASAMPPYTLPDEKTKTTFKSNSSTGGGGFNEFRFEDKKGSEQVYLHAQKQLDVRVNANYLEYIGAEKHEIVKADRYEKVEKSKNQQIMGDKNENIKGGKSLGVGGNHNEKIGQKWAVDAGTEIHLKSGTTWVAETGTSLTLKVGGNFININSGGIFIKGTMVMLNSGGAAGSGSGASPSDPKPPMEADNATPGSITQPPPKKPVPQKPAKWSPCAITMKNAARTGAPFCEICNQ